MTAIAPGRESLENLLISAENLVKNHYALLQSTTDVQREVLDRMWVLAQRYTILIRGVPTKRTYPTEACHRVEDEIRTEFHMRLSILDDSNSRLTRSLSNVKDTFYALGRFVGEMDSCHLTSVDQADPIQQPISYYLEIFADFVKFFTHTQSKLNCYAILLRADNVSSLERYKMLLEPNREFDDHFLKSLLYSCLHTNKKEKT